MYKQKRLKKVKDFLKVKHNMSKEIDNMTSINCLTTRKLNYACLCGSLCDGSLIIKNKKICGVCFDNLVGCKK